MKLHFREYGSGSPPLLILHGLFGSGDNWHTIARRLEKGRRVVAADLRNHGQSPHSELFTFPAMASDAAELLDHLGISTADVLGHSLGGKVGMELALSRPGLVRRLVVVDIAPKSYAPHNADLKDAMLELDLSSIRSRRDTEERLAARVPDRTVQLFLLKNLIHEGDGSFRWRINLDGIARNFSETGAPIAGRRRFEGPVLFLRGELSDYIDPTADRPLIESLFPNARLQTVNGATHWVHADRPEEVVAAVEEFLGA